MEKFFTEFDEFGYDQGMNFAVAFTAYNNVREPILDPEYGYIYARANQWGLDEDGKFKSQKIPIPMHTCTREELGLDEGEQTFFNVKPDHRDWIDLYQQKFLCFDTEMMRARGSFHSKSARTLQFQLKRCVNSTDSDVVCKPDEEITEFMKGKYMLLLSNQIRFNPRVFGEESIVAESSVGWYRLSVQK